MSTAIRALAPSSPVPPASDTSEVAKPTGSAGIAQPAAPADPAQLPAIAASANALAPPALAHGGRAVGVVSLTASAFDREHYLKLIQARGDAIRRFVAELKPALELQTALDAGCGLGFFSSILRECGLAVRGFDARAENIAEAQKRFPEIPFFRGDIEKPELHVAGKADLVLCFGLLYHLENPMLAIRNLRALTGKGLLLESMCLAGDGAEILLREEPAQEDQSLTEIALYPSEGCLVKMLYRAGFAAVYRLLQMPDHEDFRETRERHRRRTVLFASPAPVAIPGLEILPEPGERSDPWVRPARRSARQAIRQHLKCFAEQRGRTLYFGAVKSVRKLFPAMPTPLRLPFGAWWLAENSALDHELLHKRFERIEMRLFAKLLRPGMTVLDVGAHHGFYTLLASKRVGRSGNVWAFEPSPRERARLVRHVRVNRCRNVRIAPFALGNENGNGDLFLVEGQQDWCNSLHPPVVDEFVQPVSVALRRLDDVLDGADDALISDAAPAPSRVDFIKLDVEGGELNFLKGAIKTLRASRPAILAEVQDLRTIPWGYAAREIVQFLACRKYLWFASAPDGSLRAISPELPYYNGNLLALPAERLADFRDLVPQ